jgi:hypothetical protein
MANQNETEERELIMVETTVFDTEQPGGSGGDSGNGDSNEDNGDNGEESDETTWQGGPKK